TPISTSTLRACATPATAATPRLSATAATALRILIASPSLVGSPNRTERGRGYKEGPERIRASFGAPGLAGKNKRWSDRQVWCPPTKRRRTAAAHRAAGLLCWRGRVDNILARSVR